jgi:hypothetical protein
MERSGHAISTHIVHTYKIAPWRVQRQWIGGFLLAVVVLTMIASLCGCRARHPLPEGNQDLTPVITTTKQTGAVIKRVSFAQSQFYVEQQAIALGFEPVGPEK